MSIFAAPRLRTLRRRTTAVALGLFAVWMQLVAYAAGLPAMAMEASELSLPHCLGEDLSGDKQAPSGKSQIPCPQCPVCQTIQALGGSAPLPAIGDVAYGIIPESVSLRPASETLQSPFAVPAGFSSRAPPFA